MNHKLGDELFGTRPADLRCWIDGNIMTVETFDRHVVSFAQSWGYHLDSIDEHAFIHPTSIEWEHQSSEIADDAVTWLNECVADGYLWIVRDGGLYLDARDDAS